MKLLVVIASIIMLPSLSACQSDSGRYAKKILENSPSPVNMNAGKDQYTVYLPDGWTTSSQTYNEVDYYFLIAPQTADDPNTNINITTEYMQEMSLIEYVAGDKASIMKSVPGATMLDEGTITADTCKGVWFRYTMDGEGVHATLISYVFPHKGVAYALTAGTQTKDAARYRPLFDKIASSLRFNP